MLLRRRRPPISWRVIPTEALLAQVAVAKFSEHMPLYRQSQVLARHGIFIDRAVLADWMGTVAFHLAPLVERKRVFYRTGYARGWPRRRVTPGPSSVIGTAWLT
ncbi:transposase [Bradyrhizobium diazoefficiens]